MKNSNPTPYWIKIFSSSPNSPNKVNPVELYLQIKDFYWTQYQIAVQLFRPEFLLSFDHLSIIIHHVDRAFLQNTNISPQKAMEFLLYLSGQRQISEAIAQVGFEKRVFTKNQAIKFGIVIFGSSDKLEKVSREILDKFSQFSVEDFIPVHSQDLKTFASRYGFIDAEIMNIFFSYPEAERYSSITPDALLARIPENFARSILLDALNLCMVELFLRNYKDIRNKFQE